MKKVIAPLLVLSLFFIACYNNKSKDDVTISDENGKKEVSVDLNQVKDAALDMQKKKDELS